MDIKPEETVPQILLDDADFLRLMEAEYKNSNLAVDEIEKQKIWSSIKKKRPTKKNSIHHIWLLAATVLLACLPLLKFIPGEDELHIKGHGPEANVKLNIQLLNTDGRIEALEQPRVGQTLLFKVSSPTASHLALTLQIDADPPKLQLHAGSPVTGLDQILAADGQAFVYQVDQSGQTLKFCLLAARSGDDLQQQIQNLEQQWSRIGAKFCQTLVIP